MTMTTVYIKPDTYEFPARTELGPSGSHALRITVNQDQQHPTHLFISIGVQSYSEDGKPIGIESSSCWMRFIPYTPENDDPLYEKLINLETSSKLLTGSVEDPGKICVATGQQWFDFCGEEADDHEEYPDEYATGVVFRVAESGVFRF